jgi:hypothetical protein
MTKLVVHGICVFTDARTAWFGANGAGEQVIRCAFC